MENCLASRCSETKAAVISGRAANGPSSPDAHYSDTIYRKAVWTKDGRVPPEPVLRDSVMSGRHLGSVMSGLPLF